MLGKASAVRHSSSGMPCGAPNKLHSGTEEARRSRFRESFSMPPPYATISSLTKQLRTQLIQAGGHLRLLEGQVRR